MTADDSTCPSEDALADFLAGTADDRARAEIETHIDDCPRCAETLALFGGAYASRVAAPNDSPPPEPESFAGRYRIRECVGAGAGGTVYAAWDPELDRIVALKVLRGQAPGGSKAAHRIAREARVMAKVVHPNVVTVHDVGSAGEHVFIATEFIEGRTLDAWRHAAPRSVAQILDVFIAAGRGLAAIHACGLVHRDFKPHNVMVGDDGRVCVTDFGLARLQPELALEFATTSMDTSVDPMMSPGMLAETLATQTRTGAMVGTPAYMSPEQWRGRIADARSDQFSFCVALYEALFEARPFVGRTAAELSAEVCEGNPQIASARHVPRWVVRVVRRGFSRVPDERYPDMDALLSALTETPRRRRRRRITGMLATGFVAVGVGAYGLARLPAQAGCTEPDRLTALWNPEAQADVSAVLGDAFASTHGELDAWVDAWRAAQREVCTHIDDPARSVAAQASLECLDRRLSSMHAALSVMRESGPSGAALASMIETMPSPAECADAGKWLTIQPDHHTPMGRVLAATLAEDVDRIEALRYAGRHDEAVAIAIAVLAQAEIDGDHAVRAMALATLGQLYSAHKDAERALTTLRAAAWAAEASGHVEIAVDAWTEIAAVVGGQLERYEDGLEAIERADAALFRLRDPARALTLASNEAMLHSMAGRYDLAHARQVEMLARSIEMHGPRHRQVARVHMNVAAVLTHLGRLDEATLHAQTGIAIHREYYPGPHPVTADMLSTLGVLEIQRGNEAAARVALDEALGMLDETTDASRATRTNVLSNRAALDIGRGDGKAAIEGYREVLAIRRASSGPTHADIAAALHNLAHAHDKAGDVEAAIATYREALEMRLVTNGPDHPSTGNTLHNLGAILVKESGADEGMAMLERALELREQANVDPWRRASTHYALAKGYERRGDRTRALESIAEARALLADVGPRGAELTTAMDTWVDGLPNAGR